VKVRLNEDDIELGVRGSPWSCPWALAIRRATRRSTLPLQVSDDGLHDLDGDLVVAFPTALGDWISNFDDTGVIDGWYELWFDLPDSFMKPQLRQP